MTCENGSVYEAPSVIVTVSMQILKEGLIAFLPTSYQESLDKFPVEPSVKVFIEFNNQFYPTLLELESDCNKYSEDASTANYLV